jgi:hypothetical protein
MIKDDFSGGKSYMKKTLVSIGILAVCIILIPIASPLVYSHAVTQQKTIPIETLVNSETGRRMHTTCLSSSEVEELRQVLIMLDDALAKKDSREILYYETMLKSKGIIPATYHFETTKPFLEPRYQTIRQHLLSAPEDTISNSMCYVHATGTGLLVFTIGVLLVLPVILLVTYFGLEILTLLLPLLILLLIATHMIPFRVLLPVGVIILEEGSISAVGSAGSQQITVDAPSVQVNLIGFTGITINIPSSNLTQGFLFVSGFSFYAYSQNTSQNHTTRIVDNNLFFRSVKSYHR